MSLFGQSKKEIWKEVAAEIGGGYVNDTFFINSRIEYVYKNHKIFMDIKSPTIGTRDSIATRIRFGFKNPTNAFFSIRNKGIGSSIGEILQHSDVKTGYSTFDEKFIIKTDNEDIVEKLITNEEIRKLIEDVQKFELYVINAGGKLYDQYLGENETILQIRVPRIIKDAQKIKDLFKLCTKMIDVLE
ncbi:hypothetical protein PV797_08610 [Clostridiaceae bacterium M8S5]|nr:hypothetical protein PV797_08610 [Clostridiaceae bacterium M8S5]